MAAHAPEVSRLMRLPFFYGWIIVAVTFVTMAIGVNARTVVLAVLSADHR